MSARAHRVHTPHGPFAAAISRELAVSSPRRRLHAVRSIVARSPLSRYRFFNFSSPLSESLTRAYPGRSHSSRSRRIRSSSSSTHGVTRSSWARPRRRFAAVDECPPVVSSQRTGGIARDDDGGTAAVQVPSPMCLSSHGVRRSSSSSGGGSSSDSTVSAVAVPRPGRRLFR